MSALTLVSAAAACGETSIRIAEDDCLQAELAAQEASVDAGMPRWRPPGTSGFGNSFISDAPRIAGDMGAFRRLKPTRLPFAGVCAVREQVRTNHAGRALVEEGRLLVQTRGRRVYVVPTSRGDVCSYLEPQGIPDCSGYFRGQPRLYAFYHYDDGLPLARRRLVVFGFVPDKVREVSVLVRCRPYAAVTANGGFYYERRGQSASEVNGFVYRLRNGEVKRRTYGVSRLKGSRQYVRACSH